MHMLKPNMSEVVCDASEDASQEQMCVGVRHHLGEDEAVVVGVAGVFRSVLHGMKEQHRHDLCCAAT